MAGVRTRAAMLNAGMVRGWAYVEAGALAGDITADDAISCSELMQKLDELLMKHFYGSHQPIGIQPMPYIVECYPFENYLIFRMQGQTYRYQYVLDPIARKVSLVSSPQLVQEKFVDVAAGAESMPRSDTGARYAYAPAKGMDQTFTTGGKNSELVTQIVRSMSNIHEAVAMYLNYVRLCGASRWQPPTANTVHKLPLSPEHKLLVAHGVNPFAFAAWASMALLEAKAGQKTVGTGDKVGRDKFAYVGDKNDPSTWHLPLHDANHVKNALSRVNQTQGIPDAAKPGVMGKLRKAAKHHGIDVAEKLTPGQKHWTAGGPGSGPHPGDGVHAPTAKPSGAALAKLKEALAPAYKSMADRTEAAHQRFLDILKEQHGFSHDKADLILTRMLQHGLAKTDHVVGHVSPTDGRFMEKDVLEKISQLPEKLKKKSA